MAAAVGYHIVILIVPQQSIGACFIGPGAEMLQQIYTPIEVAESDLSILRDSIVDHIDCREIFFTLGLDPSCKDDLATEECSLVDAGLSGKFPDQLAGMLGRKETGGQDCVDQEL
jgi:hypothetical protein